MMGFPPLIINVLKMVMVIPAIIIMIIIRRTLPAGSLILEERPLVVTPKTSITLTCVNCCSRLISNITVIITDGQDWSPLPTLSWLWISPLPCLSTFSTCLYTCLDTCKWCLSTFFSYLNT